MEELEWNGTNNKKEIADKLVQSGLHLNELDKCLYVARRDKETYQDMLQTSEVIILIYTILSIILLNLIMGLAFYLIYLIEISVLFSSVNVII